MTLIDATTFPSIETNYAATEQFAGKPVLACTPGMEFDGSMSYRFASDWDNESGYGDAMTYLLSEARPQVTHIILGAWAGEELFDSSSAAAIQQLVDNAALLPNLEAIFIGEILQEENEMSWIQQSDISPLLQAFPNLQVLRSRGGEGLALSHNSHENLRCLAIETGGMSGDVLRSITTGSFPKLEHLELWLGTEQYGGSCSVVDLQPILSGALFPNLTYLGLKNCDFVDQIAGVVVNSPVVNTITTLDLSMGVLTDDGAEALKSLPTDDALKNLAARHHFMSEEMMAAIDALALNVDVSGREVEDEWRFVAIGE